MADWAPYAPETIGLTWFPTAFRDRVVSDPNRGIGAAFESTVTETRFTSYVPIACQVGGDVLLEVFDYDDAVAELAPVTTDTFRPNAQTVNAANLWQNQAGATSNIYQAIDEATLSLTDYIRYLGSYTQKGQFRVNVGSAGWGAGQRVVRMRWMFWADTQNGDGRLNVVVSDGTTSTIVGQRTITEDLALYSVDLGELNPATALPWTQADVAALDAAASIGWQPLSGRTVDIRIYQAWLEVDWIEENRVAVGHALLTPTGLPLWTTFDLVDPNSGSAGWSKTSGARYVEHVRGLSGAGVSLPRFTVRTLDDGAPLPTGWVGLRPTIDAVGRVTALGDELTECPGFALLVSSGVGSVDGQPYINAAAALANDASTAGQMLVGADGGDYELARFLVGWRGDGDPTDDLNVRILRVSDDAEMSAAVLTPAEWLALDDYATYPTEFTVDPPGGMSSTDFGDVTGKLVELAMPAATLAAATEYGLEWSSDAADPDGWVVLMLTTYDILTLAQLGRDAARDSTYGEGAVSAGASEPPDVPVYYASAVDAPATASTIPDAPANPAVAIVTRELPDGLPAVGDCAAVDSTDEVSVTWDPTALDPDVFARYEVQRQDDRTDWATVASITDQMVDEWIDPEPRRSLEASYRLRVVRTDGVGSAWADAGAVTPEARGCELILTSAEDPTLTVAYQRTDTRDDVVWEFEDPGADDVELVKLYDRDYQVALRPAENRGTAFTITLLVWANDSGDDPPAGAGAIAYDRLRAIAAAPLSYVCVLDPDGNRWFASVVVGPMRWSMPANAYVARVQVVEVTDTPSQPDAIGSVLALADGWWSAEEWDG